MTSASSPTGPTGAPIGFRPLRAVAIVVVAVVVGVVVLVRMGGVPTHASSTSSSTAAVVRTTTTTTTPTSSSSTLSTTSTVPARLVTVLVLNGYTTRHAALYFQKKLAALGYDTRAPADAATSTDKTSQVFVVSALDLANAEAVAQALGLSPSAVLSPTPANDPAIPPAYLHQADLIVVVGADISREVPPGYNG